MAQYTFSGDGEWSDPGRWTNSPDASFLSGIINIGGDNISIEGNVTVPSGGLNFVSLGEIVVVSGYTLDIWDGVNISDDGFVIRVQSGGFFVVHGSFIVDAGASSEINLEGGYFSVNGSLEENGDITGTFNGTNHVYITGTETGDFFDCADPSTYTVGGGPCEYGDRAAIIVNEPDPDIRKILLGTKALSIDYTQTPVSCSGDSDGSLTVQADGGSYLYQYSINNIDWFPAIFTATDYTFTNLSAAVHTVYVRDDDTPQATGDFPASVLSPDPLTFSVAQPNLCAGEIEVTVNGGNPNYAVNVSGTEQTGAGPFTFSSLSAGDVTVTVADANSCPSTPASETFTVQVDAAEPQFADFPADQQVLYSDYESFASLQTGVSIITDNNSNTLSHNGSFDYGPIDLSNYTNATMDFTFTVSETAVANDYIRFSYSYNGTDYTQFAVYDSQNGTKILGVALPLNELPSDNNSVTIRVSGDFQTGGLSYEFTNFEITADEVFSTTNIIAPAALPSCTDDVSGCNGSPTPTDAAPIWLCNSGLIKEFYFIRTWRIVDDCSKETTRPQRVSVGTAPTITAANDTIIDFCNAATITLPNPTVNDDCSLLANLTITWEIFDGDMVSTGQSGPAPLAAALAYSATQDTVYTVTWTVTDQAGFFATDNQTITIKPAINIDIEYPDYNFCSGDEVIFNVTITGGTGVYNVPASAFSITGTWNNGGNANNSIGTFTTSALGFEVGLFNEFTITVNDVTTSSPNPEITGGCPSDGFSFSDGNGSGEFDIHEKISTNVIERFD